jgi:hypothetical protein
MAASIRPGERQARVDDGIGDREITLARDELSAV